jgi:excisionase family DNA binding protein
MEKIYKTGEIARMLSVASRTVQKWIDAGHLTGYLLPYSNARRVTKSALVKFVKDNGLPMPDELSGDSE